MTRPLMVHQKQPYGNVGLFLLTVLACGHSYGEIQKSGTVQVVPCIKQMPQDRELPDSAAFCIVSFSEKATPGSAGEYKKII